jgi:hypothetical protein
MTQPWSETVTLAEISRGPVTRTLVADDAARRRIARELNLDSLDALQAQVTASEWLDGAEIDARWTASIEQTCGVSLERFGTELEGGFTVRVLPAGSPNAPREEAQEIAVDPEGDDPPDVLEGEDVDLAAYVVEHLAIEIDPFPRKPGVTWDAPPPEEPASPFAVLKALKKD